MGVLELLHVVVGEHTTVYEKQKLRRSNLQKERRQCLPHRRNGFVCAGCVLLGGLPGIEFVRCQNDGHASDPNPSFRAPRTESHRLRWPIDDHGHHSDVRRGVVRRGLQWWAFVVRLRQHERHHQIDHGERQGWPVTDVFHARQPGPFAFWHGERPTDRCIEQFCRFLYF